MIGDGMGAVGPSGEGGPDPALLPERVLHGLASRGRRSLSSTAETTPRTPLSSPTRDNVTRCSPEHGALSPEPALPCRVRTDGPQEVDPPEVRPVRLAEVELRVRALPEQESPQALLARRADHEL